MNGRASQARAGGPRVRWHCDRGAWGPDLGAQEGSTQQGSSAAGARLQPLVPGLPAPRFT